MLAVPFGSVASEPPLSRVLLVNVCLPSKDQARMASGLQLADLLPQRKVKTSSFVPADVSPAQQAAENRKRRTAKR